MAKIKNKEVYFKIFRDRQINVELHGNFIKILRKKVYKQLLYKLLDKNIESDEMKKATEAFVYSFRKDCLDKSGHYG